MPEIEATFGQVLKESRFIFGKQVEDFENEFASKCGVKHCIATGNCTDALYIVLKMLGIGEGDEVLVPAMTWITDAEIVTQLGATPVFVDVIPQLHTIDIVDAEAKITEKTKAIIPVHLYGRMANMQGLVNLAETRGIKLIEDCAQSHFATLKGKYAGSFGDVSVFSFYPSKNLGALGDAGCILTNNDELALACRKYANHGGIGKNDHDFPGINSRMDTLQAAVLLLKLKYIDQWNAERNRLAFRYNEHLEDIEELGLPKISAEEVHAFHVYAITSARRNELKSFLEEKGVQTEVHYPKAVPFTKAYSNFSAKPEAFPVSYKLQNEVLSLPIFPGLSQEQQDYVIKQVKIFYKK